MPYSVPSGAKVRGGRYKPICQNPTYPQRLNFRGTPQFFCGPGDPEGFLFLGDKMANGRRAGNAQGELLDVMEANGGNIMYFQSCRKPGDGTADEVCWEGENPNNPPDKAIMQQWRAWFRRAESLDIMMLFFIWDDISNPQNNPYGPGTAATLPQGEIDYITALVEEFKDFDNIIWITGEEMQKEWSVDHVSGQASVIRSVDEQVAIGTHQLSGNSFLLADDNNSRVFAVQLNNFSLADVYTQLEAIWSDAVAKGYCYVMSEIGDPPSPRGAEARKHDWVALLAGACGASRLEMDLQHMNPTELGAELQDCQRLIDFTNDTLWYVMAPNDADIVAGIDHLMSGQDHHIAWREGYTTAFQIANMAAGTYDVLWQSCDVDGQDASIAVVSAGTNTFVRPAGISSECALYLERQ